MGIAFAGSSESRLAAQLVEAAIHRAAPSIASNASPTTWSVLPKCTWTSRCAEAESATSAPKRNDHADADDEMMRLIDDATVHQRGLIAFAMMFSPDALSS